MKVHQLYINKNHFIFKLQNKEKHNGFKILKFNIQQSHTHTHIYGMFYNHYNIAKRLPSFTGYLLFQKNSIAI